MKPFAPLAFLIVAFARQGVAEETRLICTGVHSGSKSVPAGQTYNPNTGLTEQRYTSVPVQTEMAEEIRFDEATRQLWYKGIAIIGGEKDGEGWARAKRVTFTEKTIEAEFDLSGRGRARNILSFGLAQAMEGKPIGVLDRYSGLWRLLGDQLSCIKVETAERKF